MTAIPLDIDSAQESQGLKFKLLGPQFVSGDDSSASGTSSSYSGFSAFSSVYFLVDVTLRQGYREHPLTVTVEHSDDELSWVTAHAFSFSSDGSPSVTVSSPKDFVRVLWSAGVGSEWSIVSVVAVAPTTSNGGSQTFLPPDGREFFLSGQTTVPGDFSGVAIPLSHDSGGVLLDYTDPTLPTIITSGLYAFYVGVFVPAHADAGVAVAIFNLDFNGADVSPNENVALSPTTGHLLNFYPVYYLAAGMTIEVFAQQGSGTDIVVDVESGSYIQRIA